MYLQEHLLYRLGEQLYAMPIEHVESIERILPITPIPQQPRDRLGVAVIRHHLVSVLDTAWLMGIEGVYTDDDMIIVIEGKIAFRVSEARDIARIEENEIQHALNATVWLHDGVAIPLVDLTKLKTGSTPS